MIDYDIAVVYVGINGVATISVNDAEVNNYLRSSIRNKPLHEQLAVVNKVLPTYQFLLYADGRLTYNRINAILKDIKNTNAKSDSKQRYIHLAINYNPTN